MTKDACTQAILQAKQELGISYQQIANHIGRDIVWTTSALLGQNSVDATEARKIASLLELGPEVEKALIAFPLKGSSLESMPPTDPLIYRLYEIVLVYGTSMKAVIHEKFGDGIMSAIDFSMHIDKVENPNGDRVKVTMEGKFLPYKKW